jgi:ferredoxin/flavodoxin
MKLGIVYFSGTGNTAWVAQRLVEQLRVRGDEATALSCEDVPVAQLDMAAWDMMGIAFPVHSSFAAPVFRDYLAQLPPAGKPLFAVTTAGYWAGDTAWYAAQPLTRRGYRLFLCANVLMPNNFFIPKMDFLPVTPPTRVPRFLARATRRIVQLAKRIHMQKHHIEGTGSIGRLGGALQRWGYASFESKMPARFSADERCMGCGWCTRHCPTQSWELRDGRACFVDRGADGGCFFCMRCYSFCPVQAIQATDKTRRATKYRRYQGPEGIRYPH